MWGGLSLRHRPPQGLDLPGSRLWDLFPVLCYAPTLFSCLPASFLSSQKPQGRICLHVVPSGGALGLPLTFLLISPPHQFGFSLALLPTPSPFLGGRKQKKKHSLPSFPPSSLSVPTLTLCLDFPGARRVCGQEYQHQRTCRQILWLREPAIFLPGAVPHRSDHIQASIQGQNSPSNR
jgi:hypothetical protein